MIAVDTSALMAIVLNETSARQCADILANERIVISAATLAETLIVAERRGFGTEMANLIDGLGLDVVNVSAAMARQVADAYAQWGKGVHPASLNFGDCFAYALAQAFDCRLLFVGSDFTRTDITPALQSAFPIRAS